MTTASTRVASLGSSSLEHRDPRSKLLRQCLHTMFEETGIEKRVFVIAMCDIYGRSTAPKQRTLPFQPIPTDLCADDFEDTVDRRRASFIAILDRDERHVPLDLEELCIDTMRVLAPEFASDYINALISRHGRIGFEPIAGVSPADDLQAIASILQETARVAEGYAPLIADGVVNKKDRPLAGAVCDQIDAAVARLIGLRSHIEDQTRLKGAA